MARVKRTLLPWMFMALAASPVFSQPAAAPTLAALARLESGQWQLRSADGGAPRSICLTDARALLGTT